MLSSDSEPWLVQVCFSLRPCFKPLTGSTCFAHYGQMDNAVVHLPLSVTSLTLCQASVLAPEHAHTHTHSWSVWMALILVQTILEYTASYVNIQ